MKFGDRKVKDYTAPEEILDEESDDPLNTFNSIRVGDWVGAWWSPHERHYSAEVVAVKLFQGNFETYIFTLLLYNNISKNMFLSARLHLII